MTLSTPQYSLDRFKQIKGLSSTRRDINISSQSMNEGLMSQNKVIKDWIKEYVISALSKISFDELDTIKEKLIQVYGVQVKTDSAVVECLANTIIGRILLPDYVDEGNGGKERFKKELQDIIERILHKIDITLLKEQKSPFILYLGDTASIEDELDFDGDFGGGQFWMGNGFGYNLIGYNTKYKKFAVDIPVRIAIPSKLNGEIKETDPKKVQTMLEEHFGKNGKSPKNKKWKGFQVSTKIHTDSEKNYGRIEKARYLIVTITHEEVEDLNDEFFSHDNILDYLGRFIALNNFLIAESAKVIGWDGKTKRASLIRGDSEYVSSGDEPSTEIDDEIRTKFGRLMVHVKDPIKLEDIGGQEKAKAEIDKIIALIKNRNVAEAWGAHMTTGIIFYGPSGTGKTLMARALATGVEADVYAIKMTDLANTAYINEGPKNVQDLFKYLRNQAQKNPNKKLIVIFDELDALFKNRSNRGSSGEDTKIVNTFLTEMDGFDSLQNLIIVGTTNRLESIDSAIKRPGRLSTHIKVDLPGLQERGDIFRIHIRLLQKRARRQNILDIQESDYVKMAELSEGFSGAEIAEVIRITAESKFYEEVIGESSTHSIRLEDILHSIDILKTRNGNKNNILRDVSPEGLAQVIQDDKTGVMREVFLRMLGEKLFAQIGEKMDSGATSIPTLMSALQEGKKGKMGF